MTSLTFNNIEAIGIHYNLMKAPANTSPAVDNSGSMNLEQMMQQMDKGDSVLK